MVLSGTILRLMLAALTAMWVPSWCYCIAQAHASPSPLVAAVDAPADDCCAAGEQAPVQSARHADRTAGEGCCCQREPADPQGCHMPGKTPGDHECDSCGQNVHSPYVDARSAKVNLAELAPAFLAPASLSPLLTVTDPLPAGGAWPFDTTDGPPQTSLLALGCLLTI